MNATRTPKTAAVTIEFGLETLWQGWLATVKMSIPCMGAIKSGERGFHMSDLGAAEEWLTATANRFLQDNITAAFVHWNTEE